MDKKDLLKKLIQNLKSGLSSVESSKNGYSALNKDTSALGKYQFLPKYYWNDIKSFAKRKHNLELNSYDDFLNTPFLQEDYFENYVEKQVLPKAEKMYSQYSEKGFRLDEVAALIHFQGESGANKILSTGKHKSKTDINIGTEEYLAKYNKGLEQNRLTGILSTDTLSEKEKEKIWKNYNQKKDSIIYDKNLSEDVKRLKLDALNKAEYQKGNFPVLNENIDKVNQNLEQEFQKNNEDFQKLLNLAENTDVLYYSKDGKQKFSNFSTTAFSNLDAKELEEISKKYPGLLKKGSNGFNKIDGSKLMSLIENGFENITGKKIDLIDQSTMERGKDLTIDVSKMKTGLAETFNKFGFDNTSSGTLKFKDNLSVEIASIKFNKDKHGFSTLKKNRAWENTKMESTNQEELPKPSTQNPYQYTEEDIKNAQKQSKQDGYNEAVTEFDNELLDANNDYYSMVGNKPETGTYDPKAYKDNFPFADVLASTTGAIIGLKQADKKTPLRNEQVSDAFRNYTSELKRLSEIGLRPEEEAYAKRMLAESYQSGIQNIVKASGGNRNIVLGNLGRLDAQKQKGLMQIAISDAQAKNEALNKYGEAIKYINEFDARRDIANNEREYQNAMLTKEAGAQLASQSFANLMENIQYYRENKPGSANHAYKSYVYRKRFDVDPTLKDDGTGNTPYTMSWKKKQDDKIMSEYLRNVKDSETWSQLNKDQKMAVAQFNEQTNYGNKEATRNFMDYISKDTKPGEMNFENLSNAIKENDFSYLFQDNTQNKTNNNLPFFNEETIVKTPDFNPDTQNVFSQKEEWFNYL